MTFLLYLIFEPLDVLLIFMFPKKHEQSLMLLVLKLFLLDILNSLLFIEFKSRIFNYIGLLIYLIITFYFDI
ncbi:hypothetical protein DD595_26215 [Enterobacter cloacae complex sp. 4DZ3-17B2]|nr:hypothetical protein DD595_26215 [Enterobacter cloacae complex sp. 4DZ3-17B2]